MTDYDKPPELYSGLRLHQNEHTGGCSPRVLEALAALRAEQISVYPPYAATVARCARHLGVPPEWVGLVNGLDEGILAVALTCLQRDDLGVKEAIVPEPAFEIFAIDAELAGGRVVRVMPKPGFEFATDEVVAAISPATRVVFITNPNNPTGATVPLDAVRTIARRMPRGGLVFVDEAYADFGGETFIPALAEFPQVVVGRTFSKAYGLAGIRIGALVAEPDTLAAIQRVIPVYSVNVAAIAALRAALDDRAYVERYLDEVRQSKQLVYETCERLGLAYWKSAGNFVLIRTGARTPSIVEETAARGIYLRDRSNEPGCEGCLRITAGLVGHTRRGLAVLEEVLCAAR